MLQRWRPIAMVVCLMVMVMPWLTGGRDLAALVVDVAAATIALFLLWVRPTVRLPRDPVAVAGGLFMGWSGLSLLWSVNRYQTWLTLLPLILAAVAFLIARYLRSLEWPVEWLTVAYLLVATGASGYGFWLYATGDYDRLTSAFYWPNPFAAYLLPGLFLTAWWFGRSTFASKSQSVWLAGALTVVNGAAFILTTSRGATLVLAAVMVAALVFARLGRWFWIKIVFIIIITFGLSTGISFVRNHVFHHAVVSSGSRFIQTVQEEGQTDAGDRWNFLISAVNIWRTSPLWGTGAGTYPTMHPQYQVRVISAGASAHNVYVQTLAELGVVGAVLLAITTLGLLWRAWQGWRLGLAGGGVLLVSVLALAMHFGLDIDDRYPALLILTGIIAGLAVGRSANVTSSAPRRHWGWVLGGLVVLAPIVLSLYYSDQAFSDGQIYQQDGNWTQAQASFRDSHRAIAYNPDNWTAEGIVEYVLAQSGQDRQLNLSLAKDRALAAMKLDPHDAQHAFLLARVERLAGDLPGAEQAYHQALELDPYNHPMYYADLADLYLQVGQADNAALYIGQGLKFYPDTVVSNRGAEEEVAPEVARLYVERATLEFKSGQTGVARADLQHALRLDPSNAVAKALLNQ